MVSRPSRYDHATSVSVIPERIHIIIESYLRVCRIAGHKPYTLQVYRRTIQKLADFLSSEFDISSIHQVKSDHLREYFFDLQDTHNTGGVEVYFRPVHAMFAWYWREYEIERRNPFDMVKIKHQRIIARPGVPLENIERMVAACIGRNKARDIAMLYGLLDTCARATEFCSFRVKDVDFATGRAYIEHGKGDKPRYVRFGSKSIRALRRYLKTRAQLYAHDPLFVTDEDEPLNANSLRLLVDRRADDAGVPHCGLHDFRRRGAALLWKRTRDWKGVSEYLGHANVVVTQRYVAVDEDDIMETHEKGSPVDNWL
jgi:site-specific recombinase XerD